MVKSRTRKERVRIFVPVWHRHSGSWICFPSLLKARDGFHWAICTKDLLNDYSLWEGKKEVLGFFWATYFEQHKFQHSPPVGVMVVWTGNCGSYLVLVHLYFYFSWYFSCYLLRFLFSCSPLGWKQYRCFTAGLPTSPLKQRILRSCLRNWWWVLGFIPQRFLRIKNSCVFRSLG
jgi:hypothetical protein